MSYGLWNTGGSVGRACPVHTAGAVGGTRLLRRHHAKRRARPYREHLLASGASLHHRPHPCAQPHQVHERAAQRGEVESARQHDAHRHHERRRAALHQHEGRHPAARFAHPHRRALRDRGSFRAHRQGDARGQPRQVQGHHEEKARARAVLLRPLFWDARVSGALQSI